MLSYDGGMVLNVRDIPDEVMRKFKAACILEGKTIKEVLIEIMEQYAEEQSKKK